MRMLLSALLLAGALSACTVSDTGGPLSPETSESGSGTGKATTTDAPTRGAFHTTPYRRGNSLRGLKLARKTDRWIDIDSNYCWDADRRKRIPLATHWPRLTGDDFIDPDGEFGPETPFAELSLPEVRRLHSNDPIPYRVSTMTEMVREASRLGFTGIEWEVKGGPAFTRAATYRRVIEVAAEVDLEINVKTLTQIGGTKAALSRLRAAKSAGATTMLLNHTNESVTITDARARYVDYVRGPWRTDSVG